MNIYDLGSGATGILNAEIARLQAELAKAQADAAAVRHAITIALPAGGQKSEKRVSDDRDYWRIQAADVLTHLHEAERENAELRAELLSRAEKDAEDMHRLQTHCGELYAEIARLRAEVAAAQFDAAALRHAITIALPTIDAFGDSHLDMVAEHLEVWRDKPHPGAALLAELAAARVVVDAARRVLDQGAIGGETRHALWGAITAYDESRTA